ncbi:MAG: PGN_0703 family putative restriction endonuclease [Paludibacteraceae bacterium]
MRKKVDKCQICAHLKEIFGITNDIFGEKYGMAIAGDGLEYRRISTLHSSSLVALLCFYSLSKEHTLKMKVDGQEIEFYESRFEQKNSIGKDKRGKEHNSNMDVVLIGSNTQGESVILFLESKFSEYLSHGKYDKISDVYDEVYYQLTADQQPIDGLEIVRGDDMWSISAAPNRPQQYCQGIKQMISHYQGVQKGFIDSAKDIYDHIYLGEILFKLPEKVVAKHNSYNSYVGLYEQLAQKLNYINTCNKFKVLEATLSYQDMFKDFDLDPNVRKFYDLKK